MSLKSFAKKFLLGGELIATYDSPINGKIFVFEDYFGRWMRIGGVSQSGGLVVSIMKTALDEVQRRKGTEIHSVLILGLGAGNLAKIIEKKWPKAKMVGVEIDPMVVEIGKKYFELDGIKNLEIVVENALEVTSRTKFDLIFIDLYLGKEFPKEAEGDKFLNGLKGILNLNGIVVFNRFNWGEYRKQASEFKQKMEDHFPIVWNKKTVSNLLLFASNSSSKEV